MTAHGSPGRASLARQTGVPLIAVNDVLYHHPDRRELQDGAHLHPRAPDDRHGRTPPCRQCRALSQAARRDGTSSFRDIPEAIAETAATRCGADLLAR